MLNNKCESYVKMLVRHMYINQDIDENVVKHLFWAWGLSETVYDIEVFNSFFKSKSNDCHTYDIMKEFIERYSELKFHNKVNKLMLDESENE